MARTNAPLLSWGASGQIAQTQVYSEWKGRPYVRRYVIPSNPNTAAQQQTRGVFRFLNGLWRYMPSGALGGWSLAADNARLTPRNVWISQNLSNLRGQTDLNNIILSPAAGGGIAAEAMVATPGVGQIDVSLTAPSLPTGWSITAAWAMAVPDQSPETGSDFAVTAASVAMAPYDITLSGLDSAATYQVGGWFVYQKDDGKSAYGVSLIQQVTTT